MGTLRTKIEDLLKGSLDSSVDIQLEEVKQINKLSGYIIWQGFARLDQRARQQRLWSVLRPNLTPQEQQSLSVILTMTPTEYAGYLRND